MLLLSEHQLYAVALFWGREACRAVVRNDGEVVFGAEVSEELLSAGHERADDPQVPGVDGVVGLHCSEDPLWKLDITKDSARSSRCCPIAITL